MSTDEQDINGQDNHSQRTICFKKCYQYSLKSSFGHILHYGKTRHLKYIGVIQQPYGFLTLGPQNVVPRYTVFFILELQ